MIQDSGLSFEPGVTEEALWFVLIQRGELRIPTDWFFTYLILLEKSMFFLRWVHLSKEFAKEEIKLLDGLTAGKKKEDGHEMITSSLFEKAASS